LIVVPVAGGPGTTLATAYAWGGSNASTPQRRSGQQIGELVKSITRVNVSETQLEGIVRRYPHMIEEGLVYVDHQKVVAGGRLDVLLVDSGKALVVAELKVVQDDGMLLQGLDYYDYVASHIETYARLYQKAGVNPAQQVRLFLIAPSFSQVLVNRCKWLDLPIHLFAYNCAKIEGDEEIIGMFTEQAVTTPIQPEEPTQSDDHLNYITDPAARAQAAALLDEVRSWKPGHVTLDPIKYHISMKVNNSVFAYFGARRKYYMISTYDVDDEWKEFPIKGNEDLEGVKPLMKASMERRLNG
jgi:hypothetical protein